MRPSSDEIPTEPPTARPADDEGERRAVIMVVHARASARELIHLFLDFLGHEFVDFPDEDTAFAALESRTFDAAILGAARGCDAALRFTERVRAMRPAVAGHLPIVLLGAPGGSLHRSARDAGADEFLTEPVEAGRLTSVLRALVGPPA